ncbi:D-alanyl-D-alanine carboxypeptidase (penicillin-binding protein 5/6) [Desulfofundulus luciae]|uniref:serine-type D-Ala-D-Ala carboxypeptidase n=2 Tax=Desulfofundulus luciae TaxID=74702 RepID=A0ABU0B6B1_9FIRM|nr:D-alanyl-D-alanine carboxypeptidase (penicillin-binding protein 5/6) [Desulfofundulus luciae]
MDARNGQVLYQKNASSPMYPASTTKILTAIIALEHSRLDEVVTVPREATRVEGSAIGLQEGERLTMEDLLYALLLASANDAAVAIAEHVAGSVPAFAALMNEKARSIGARSSNFQNPSGLPDPRHYTTAYDLALIARYAMHNPVFRTIVSTRFKQIHRPDADRSKGPPQEHLWNHNRLLSRYEGAIGVKTGYTIEAGQCLVAAAQRNDRELIAVILNSQGAAVYSDARALLDYGFSAFKPVQLAEKGEKVSSFSVTGGAEKVEAITGNSFYFNFPAGEKPSFEQKIVVHQDLRAPLATGQKVGELVFTRAGGKELGRVDLVSARAVGTSVTRRWSTWVLGAVVFLVALRLRAMMVHRWRWRRLRYPPYLR